MYLDDTGTHRILLDDAMITMSYDPSVTCYRLQIALWWCGVAGVWNAEAVRLWVIGRYMFRWTRQKKETQTHETHAREILKTLTDSSDSWPALPQTQVAQTH